MPNHRPSFLVSCLGLAVVLAGCGQSPVQRPHAVSPNAIQARDSNADLAELGGQLYGAMHRALGASGVEQEVAMIRKAPSDVAVQRGLRRLFDRTNALALVAVPPAVDEKLGQLQIQRQIETSPRLQHVDVQRYVQAIADRLARARGVGRFQAHVLVDAYSNAYNYGGRSLVILTGLIAEAGDESELAAILAHEMAHGIHRHSPMGSLGFYFDLIVRGVVQAELGLSEDEVAKAEGLIAKLPAAEQKDRDLVLERLQGQVSPACLAKLAFRHNSYYAYMATRRDREFEADADAARTLAKAGYDPQGLSRMLDRWNDADPGDIRGVDHASPGDRLGAVRGLIAKEKLAGADRGAERHAAIQRDLPPGSKARAVAPTSFGVTLGSSPWQRSKAMPTR